MVYFIAFFVSALAPFSVMAKKLEVDKFLEQRLSSSAILKTQSIKIPHYSRAYNPSLIPYERGYLLSFRSTTRCPEKYLDEHRKVDLSFIGLVKLGPDFQVHESTVQFLNISSYSPKFSLTAEDARLICLGERIFVFFNDLPEPPGLGEFAMYFGEIKEEKEGFTMTGRAKPLKYTFSRGTEKNWTPFVSGEKIYLIYADQPRLILEVDLDTGNCSEISRTEMNWSWDLGEIRGGTPANLIDDKFVTFFHSCFPAKTPKGRAYVMGAYAFDKDPPFAVCSMTPHPLGRLKDYTDDNSIKVIFPCGMVHDKDVIHVAWGKGDKELFITTFDKQKLTCSMEPMTD